MALDTTALTAAGVAAGTAPAEAVATRAGIFEKTQAAEDAVLRPRETGRWSHALRAALAARIATLNAESGLAARYLAGAEDFAALADPAHDGAAQGLAEVVAFMDKVAANARQVSAGDIAALQVACVADADIVRLAELNAFLAYQMRVVAGLRLMRGRPA